MAGTLTAAQHLAKAELLLLNASEAGVSTEAATAWATRAHAHIATARLLYDLHRDLHPNRLPTAAMSDDWSDVRRRFDS